MLFFCSPNFPWPLTKKRVIMRLKVYKEGKRLTYIFLDIFVEINLFFIRISKFLKNILEGVHERVSFRKFVNLLEGKFMNLQKYLDQLVATFLKNERVGNKKPIKMLSCKKVFSTCFLFNTYNKICGKLYRAL